MASERLAPAITREGATAGNLILTFILRKEDLDVLSVSVWGLQLYQDAGSGHVDASLILFKVLFNVLLFV